MNIKQRKVVGSVEIGCSRQTSCLGGLSVLQTVSVPSSTRFIDDMERIKGKSVDADNCVVLYMVPFS